MTKECFTGISNILMAAPGTPLKREAATMQSAVRTGVYPDRFGALGYTRQEVDHKLEDAFAQMFYGPEDVRIYHPVDPDMGRIEDTGNHDVRTEGMSYGMMFCVQLGRKEEFDRLWRWTVANMYMAEGENAGYFAWSCQPDGAKNAYGPAPDGEEFFAMALFFAAHRWGCGEGVLDYAGWARRILHACVHKGEVPGSGQPMWDPDNHLIKFVPNCDFTDPSYHLPHFYDLFALWADEADRPFWREAAAASRAYLRAACHPVTGLCAEYAEYDGRPHRGNHPDRHDWFYSDAYRTLANLALDACWFGDEDGWARDTAGRIQRFFEKEEGGHTNGIYLIDGTRVEGSALHPVGLLATLAQGSLAADDALSDEWVRRFWATPLRTGPRRYYDNCLYLFALLALSGRYRVWAPGGEA